MKLTPIGLPGPVEPELTSLKNYILSHDKKLKSQPNNLQERSPVNLYTKQVIPPIIQKSQQLSIFTKRKATEYSGYKQCNLSRSRLITFKGQEKRPSNYKPMRSYEINIKNMMKLRKKRNMEGGNPRSQKEEEFLYMYRNCAQDDSAQIINIEKQHQSNLKKLLRNVIAKNQRHYKNPKLLQNNYNPSEESEAELEYSLISNRYSYFQKYELQSQREKYPSDPNEANRSVVLSKRNSKTNRLKDKLRHIYPSATQSISIIKVPKQMEELQLSGWQDSSLLEEKRQSPFAEEVSAQLGSFEEGT